jgi:hypothetical protein
MTEFEKDAVALYEKEMREIGRLVVKLNTLLDGEATIGYTGNFERWGDNLAWGVFLPHPGRVGTDNDRIGWFATGDLDGARDTAAQLRGAIKILKWRG